ncbi:PREDICTED: uncharacterized protein LOC109226573 [Nicotiana attenuata]|uniref:Uncharacterized protein n=1 Tax=Nicotiana attenuata TaxID=49451 RepID=A0A1J6IB58_NICAT|nr:PREDICTED: uncharacterized protein LOC109226573 [Nicotiana attenuata]OIT01676.1 hypothetical protein A4A49_41215 [Nicotiana attenuata]
MSIALERNDMADNRFKRPGFVNGMACFPIYKSPEFGAGDRCALAKQEDEEEDDRTTSSSSSSSIGRNSDESPAGRSLSDGGDGDGDGEEVLSAFKPGGLDNLEALEEVLPIKRSISQFYAGKSKSFTSLAEAASCSSLKDIVKQDDAYTKKRKNLLAHNYFFDKNCDHFPRSSAVGRMYKRATNSRSSFALAATASCSESNNNSKSLNSSPSSPCLSLPPLPPQSRRYSNEVSLPHSEQKFSAWRSFSLSDLRGAAAAIPNITGIKE